MTAHRVARGLRGWLESPGLAAVVAIALAACAGDPDVAFPPLAGPSQSAEVFSVTLGTRALRGGAPVTGTVTLTLPAPAGGLTATLSSTHPSATVPGTVTVPAGSSTATFQIATSDPGRDATATITARSPGGQGSATLTLYALLPTFLSSTLQGAARPEDNFDLRILPDAGNRFSSACRLSAVTVEINGVLAARFQVPGRRPVTPGTYENATASATPDSDGAGLSVYNGRCTPQTGRFVVHDARFSGDGQVVQFWATYEQQCTDPVLSLRGEVRVTGVPSPIPIEGCRQ